MTPTTPREALDKVINGDYGTTVGAEAGPMLLQDCLTAIAPFMQEWRPIEEAPKNEEILISGGTLCWDTQTYEEWVNFTGVSIVNWTHRGRGGWQGCICAGYDEYFWHKPTHFMPLPEPPQVTP